MIHLGKKHGTPLLTREQLLKQNEKEKEVEDKREKESQAKENAINYYNKTCKKQRRYWWGYNHLKTPECLDIAKRYNIDNRWRLFSFRKGGGKSKKMKKSKKTKRH